MNNPSIGHNLPPDLFDGTDDLPENLSRMTWFPLDIQAMRKAIFDKPLDQRGFFFSALLAMYEHMEALPADENQARLRLGGIDIRTYRRMRDLFLGYGEFFVRPSGRISNKRFEDEITKYVTEFRNRSAGRSKREERKPQPPSPRPEPPVENRPAPVPAKPEIDPRSDRSPTDLGPRSVEPPSNGSGDLFQKTNENNGCTSSIQDQVRLNEGGDIEREIEKKKESPQPPDGGTDEISTAFEQWWAIYPQSVRKVAKGECRALFRQAVTGVRRPGGRASQKVLDNGTTTIEHLLAAIRAYAATRPDPQFVPAPATYLNQGRWLDLKSVAASAAHSEPQFQFWWQDPAKVALMTLDRWKAGIDKFGATRWDTEHLGPPPGHHQCVVPPGVIAGLKLTEQFNRYGLRNK